MGKPERLDRLKKWRKISGICIKTDPGSITGAQQPATLRLDPETLDIAISSLDALQALGRKVGVISHVPILVERIGAKVVVEKQGGGRSSVVIIGGY